METTEQKIARLRALREKRDGTPLEQLAMKKAAKIRAEAIRLRRVDKFLEKYEHIWMNAKPTSR